jgi:hypothetical protein
MPSFQDWINMDAVVYDAPSPPPSSSRGREKGGGDALKIIGFK